MAKRSVAIGDKVRFLGASNWIEYEEIVVVDGFLGNGIPWTNVSKLEGGDGNPLSLGAKKVPLYDYEIIDTWTRSKDFAKPGHRVILRNLCPKKDKTYYELKENTIYRVSKQGEDGNVTLENGVEIPAYKYIIVEYYNANIKPKQKQIEINVDVSESVSALKKLQREVRTAIADIKELESAGGLLTKELAQQIAESVTKQGNSGP